MSRADLLGMARAHAMNARSWAKFPGLQLAALISSARAELAAWHAARALS